MVSQGEGREVREQTEDGSNATLWMPAGVGIKKGVGSVFPLQTLRKKDVDFFLNVKVLQFYVVC